MFVELRTSEILKFWILEFRDFVVHMWYFEQDILKTVKTPFKNIT